MFFTFKTKELEFKFISIINIVGVSVGAVATIILAYMGFRVYSLVYGMLIQSLIIQLTYAVSGMKKYRILFTLNLREIIDILKIGGYQVGTQVLDYISNKIDIFIIGRFFGMEMLGIYNLAKELVLKVIQVFNPIITNVATPAFSKIQDNLPLMQTTYLKILKFLSFVNFPVFIAAFVFAEPITIFFYGQKMIEVAVFVRILALWGLFNSVGNPAGILMVSLGRTDLGFYWTIVRILITSAVIFIASYFTIYAIAWSQVFIAFSFFFLYWRMMVYSMSKIPLSKYIAVNGMSFLLSFLSAIITSILLYFTDNIILQYGIIFLYFLLYIIFNFFFNKTFLMEIRNMVFPKPSKHFFIK
jgi:O-antigen/teichoic acid export membrane protein